MKGLILSGGAGTRLRPITHTSAKQLVPIANKPILFYGIEAMVEAGITEIGIIISPQTGGDIQDAVGDGSQFGAAITWITQDEPAGLAHCVLIARDFLADDDFVMYLGDNMLEQDLVGFVEMFTQRSQAPELGSRDPLLECNRLVLDTIEPRIEGEVDDDSTITGRVRIEAGVSIINSTVRGPAVIGADTVVRDSYIGPYSSVASGCVIESAELDHSVILGASSIRNVARLTDSLIGAHVEVDRSTHVPAGLRLMLGDHARVELDT